MQAAPSQAKVWKIAIRLGKVSLAVAGVLLVAILLTEYLRCGPEVAIAHAGPFTVNVHSIEQNGHWCRTPVLLVGNLTIDVVDKKKALVYARKLYVARES